MRCAVDLVTVPIARGVGRLIRRHISDAHRPTVPVSRVQLTRTVSGRFGGRGSIDFFPELGSTTIEKPKSSTIRFEVGDLNRSVCWPRSHGDTDRATCPRRRGSSCKSGDSLSLRNARIARQAPGSHHNFPDTPVHAGRRLPRKVCFRGDQCCSLGAPLVRIGICPFIRKLS
jgi:hypothetical protein